MQLEGTADATSPSYWLKWRVLLCAVWVVMPLVIASFMIWKYEILDHMKSDRAETHTNQISQYCKAWRPCVKEIHPIWLLAFRVFAFCLLLGTLIVKVVANGGRIFYYYTQWTFTLLIIYFACGSLLSIYGCYHYHLLSRRDLNVHCVETDAEQGPYVPLTLTYREATNVSKARRISDPQEKNCAFQAAAILSYIFEVMFQITVNMHTLNAVLLLGDTALNCLRVPLYRISFFVIWTGVYVIVQWIIHACVSIWWPYPFLDLSSPYAPLWYLLIASMHIPCYGVFSLIVELKHYLLSKRFPQSYQCQR
ncbi:uncharacterized protein LOC126714836 isoform X2 [Quercus robur]|uniref:uncharacterized protein LOC126714836 isoform X2 n=1 Tax=Quercus robur TaxID=38942 RepID=UPI002162A313|nr:uncharacterized protein LOC126714836 isoform X2 [Quercus robur]